MMRNCKLICVIEQRGTSYIRWGRKTCENHSTLVYKGTEGKGEREDGGLGLVVFFRFVSCPLFRLFRLFCLLLFWLLIFGFRCYFSVLVVCLFSLCVSFLFVFLIVCFDCLFLFVCFVYFDYFSFSICLFWLFFICLFIVSFLIVYLFICVFCLYLYSCLYCFVCFVSLFSLFYFVLFVFVLLLFCSLLLFPRKYPPFLPFPLPSCTETQRFYHLRFGKCNDFGTFYIFGYIMHV